LNAAPKITGGTDAETWALVSYLGRLNYSYKNRYLLTATIRRDGSSKFGSNKRWGTFPSIAAGWQISNEPWENASLLSNLKLRAEYGLTGNDQIGTYAYAANIQKSNYILDNSLAPGKAVTSLGNQNLSWEQTKEIDIGLDAGFLNNRVSLTADYYRSTTKSLLLNIDLPHSSGFSSSIKNIGKVRNKGIEIGVKTLNVTTENFKWNSNLNFSLNRNKVLALGPSGKPIKVDAGWGAVYGTSITEIGKPIGLFYGYKFLGLYQSEKDVENSPSYSDAVPGAMKVADINGDGKITPKEDWTIIGNPYPNFTYGMTNTLAYKGLNLTVVMTGSYGAERFKSNYGSTHNTDGVFNVTKDQMNRWRSPDHPGNGKIPTTVGTENRLIYRSMGTWSLRNASYLWIKNISLAYTLPFSITKNRLSNIVVYASIQNAFIITPYPGNPAATDYVNGSTLSPGVDWNTYPVPRISTIGIKLNL
jgi:TonB-linked SusC/RagA family outer membrane protein